MTQNHGEMRETYPGAPGDYRYTLREQDGRITFELESETEDGLPSAITLNIESPSLPSASGSGEGLCRTADGSTHPFAWAWVGPELHLWLDGALYLFQRPEPRRRGGAQAAGQSGDITAPMPGTVLEVLVDDGDPVEQNQTVIVMESMKMELLITAPRNGVVRRVSVQQGQQVERGARLLELAPEDAPPLES